MARVSENSTQSIVRYSLNKNKEKLENLQLQGSTLKQLTRPSDNPINNIETMTISSKVKDNNQYIRNIDFAQLNLNVTEKSIEQLIDILTKAKEIAISQSSDFYNDDIRKNISMEVHQLRNQALAIGNKRVGQRFIFGGFKTLTQPFSPDGKYNGDTGHTTLEISKDYFIPINLHGHEVFTTSDDSSSKSPNPLESFPDMNQENGLPPENNPPKINRELASQKIDQTAFKQNSNIISQLDLLASALENNDAELIRNLLEKFDDSVNRLITFQTKVGSISNTLAKTKTNLESDNVDHATRKSNLMDADVAELFSDLTRQQNVLKTSYQASQALLNQNLLDFLK